MIRNNSWNSPFLNKTELVIISIILRDNGSTASRLEKESKIPLSTLYDSLNRLTTQYHFLTKLDTIYIINDSLPNKERWVTQYEQYTQENTSIFRLHGVQGKLTVECPPNDYAKLRNKFIATPGKQNQFKIELEQYKIIFYGPTSISVSFPTIFGNSASDCLQALYEHVDYLIRWLEMNLSGIKIDVFCHGKITAGHIAISNSKVARDFIQQYKQNLQLTNGIVIDESNGWKELESTALDSFIEDMVKLEEVEMYYRLGKLTLKEALDILQWYSNVYNYRYIKNQNGK